MNWTVFYNYIFGDMTLEFVLAFYLFSIMGMTLTLLIHLRDSINKATKAKKLFKFKWKFWFKDNYIRIITNLVMVFIIIRFYSSLHLQYQLDMFLGFVTGFSIDTIIIYLREKTKVNIFQTVKNPE